MSESCETCRFFDAYQTSESDSGDPIGNCRRYPPFVLWDRKCGEITLCPSIYRGDWCGEYQQRADESTSESTEPVATQED